jgi:ABC-type sugar transport system permease subunit
MRGKRRKKIFGVVGRRNLKGYIFILPWLVGFVIFFAYPITQSARFAFSSIRVTANGLRMTPVKFENFIFTFTKDIYFVERLRGFFVNTVISLPVIIVFSLIIAMLINQKIRAKGFFRALFFLPIIVVSGPILEMIMSESAATIPIIEKYGLYGIVEDYIPMFMQEPVMYLLNQLILILWYSGVPILIFLAGLQKISRELYEASLIDGASKWVAFWKITLPAMKSMVLLNIIYSTVFLASSEINEVIVLIRLNMMNPNTGYGVASAMAWSYSIGVVLLLGLGWLLVGRTKKEKERVILTRQEAMRYVR